MSTLLVLGGARSGKSRYAESLASGRRIYIATSQLADTEMHNRIVAHRAQRGSDWETLEAPLDLADALRAKDQVGNFILVDCLTVWIGNLMHHGKEVMPELQKLAALLPGMQARVVLVSNEVGQGIVPDNALAREFRDLQGRCNQMMAAACSEVALVVAGIPLTIKPARLQ
jgi:adenosylcobinamide kinase/adenosylcobinamide-phosphate guanylyltransferase